MATKARTVDEVVIALRDVLPDARVDPVYDLDAVHRIAEQFAGRDEVLADFRDRTGLDNPAELLRWFTVQVPPATSAEALSRKIAALDGGEVARVVVDVPAADPQRAVLDDPLVDVQEYLADAPTGVGWRSVWDAMVDDEHPDVPQINLVDIEQGWTMEHEDLAHLGITLVKGRLVPRSRAHGTAVLSIVAGGANEVGGVGMTQDLASVKIASHSGSASNVAEVVTTVTADLECGDVLLLEVQTGETEDCAGPAGAPIEVMQVVYNAIVTATAKGIVVVEAGGNGGHRVRGPGVGDGPSVALLGQSGAIIVGAATSTEPHRRLASSCHGPGIDCYAWGENVVTGWSTDWAATDRYTAVFNGTSAAAAIIAGVVCVLQEHCRRVHGVVARGAAVRDLLKAPGLGTAAAADEDGQDPGIGVMPDLVAIVGQISAAVPVSC